MRSPTPNVLIAECGYGAVSSGLALLDLGAKVTLFSRHDPDEILSQSVRSSQALYGPAVQADASLGLRDPFPDVPGMKAVRLRVFGRAGTPVVSWSQPIDPPGISVDQRDSLSAGLRLFLARGGRIEQPDWDDPAQAHACLARRADHCDLILITSSRLGEVLFPRDPAFPAATAHRRLQMAYVRGAAPTYSSAVGFAVLPEIEGRHYGELITMPALSRGEDVTVVLIEGVPDGAWDDRAYGVRHRDPEAVWHRMQRMLDVVPDEADRFADAELIDPGGTLTGQVRQGVRYPVTTLGDTPVIALGDAWMSLDPLAPRGAWKAVLDSLDLADALRPGEITSRVLTDLIRHITPRCLAAWRFTNTLLAPPAAAQTFLAAAEHDSARRALFAHAIGDPFALEGSQFYADDCDGEEQ